MQEGRGGAEQANSLDIFLWVLHFAIENSFYYLSPPAEFWSDVIGILRCIIKHDFIHVEGMRSSI